MYELPPPTESLTQGDLIDGCPVFGLSIPPSGVDLNAPAARWVERVPVLTQACDLAQGKTSRIVVALVHPGQRLVDRGVIKASAVRDQVRRGLVYGWYFLPAAPQPILLPESVVNLHDLHTIERPILEHLVAAGKRIRRVVKPYREHLAQHSAVTYMRIGLPAPDETEP
jgi:hypothetical protein